MDDLGPKVSYLVAKHGIPVFSADEVNLGTVVESAGRAGGRHLRRRRLRHHPEETGRPQIRRRARGRGDIRARRRSSRSTRRPPRDWPRRGRTRGRSKSPRTTSRASHRRASGRGPGTALRQRLSDAGRRPGGPPPHEQRGGSSRGPPGLHITRLTSQGLATRPARDPVEVAERLLAIQGQDPRGARLAVRARSEGLVASDVDRALDERRLIITWVNRGTLHLIRSRGLSAAAVADHAAATDVLPDPTAPDRGGGRGRSRRRDRAPRPRRRPAHPRGIARRTRLGRCPDRRPGAHPRPFLRVPPRRLRARADGRQGARVRRGARLARRGCRGRVRGG